MQLSFGAILKSTWRLWSKKPDAEISQIRNEDHAYVRGDVANRGPCPGLNSLANHGFLPRDGRNISLARLEAALMEGLHITHPLAATLVGLLYPVLHADGTFDLTDVRRHNVLEHDSSLTRLDIGETIASPVGAATGADDGEVGAARNEDNYTFQPAMFDAMLTDAGPEGADLTLKSLAKSRRRRDAETKAAGRGKKMPFKLWANKWGETVAFWHSANASREGRLGRDVATIFYTEERLPKEILDDTRKRTMRGLLRDTGMLLYYVTFGKTT